MTKTSCIMPEIDFEYQSKLWEWEKLYDKLIHRDKKELGKVIGILQNFLDDNNSLLENKDYFRYFSTQVSKNIKGNEIITHLSDYLKTKQWLSSINHKDNQEVNNFQWNYSNNILRGLKHIHQGTEFLLPNEDRKTTLEFIEELQRPNVDWSKTIY